MNLTPPASSGGVKCAFLPFAEPGCNSRGGPSCNPELSSGGALHLGGEIGHTQA